MDQNLILENHHCTLCLVNLQFVRSCTLCLVNLQVVSSCTLSLVHLQVVGFCTLSLINLQVVGSGTLSLVNLQVVGFCTLCLVNLQFVGYCTLGYVLIFSDKGFTLKKNQSLRFWKCFINQFIYLVCVQKFSSCLSKCISTWNTVVSKSLITTINEIELF